VGTFLAVRTFVFDLDGVVYRGKKALPGAVDTIETLRRHGHQVYFFTNNSTQSRATYVGKLRTIGLYTEEDHVMTSAFATALYLVERGAQGKTVFVVGEEGLRRELAGAGMKLVCDGIHQKVDHVVVGMDRDFTYEKLMRAHRAIADGAEFIATNRDATFPVEGGLVVPGGGTMVAAIETATGVKPLLIGKPETYAMRKILDLAQTPPEDAVIVGDRLDTDIRVGNKIGAMTVLVLTGIATRTEVAAAAPELRPDIVIQRLPEMLEDDRLFDDADVPSPAQG